MMEKKGTKWGWIIFWLIIFWPVGLFLVIKKLATDKSALMSGKTTGLSVIGWILIAWSSLLLITVVSSPSDFKSDGALVFFMVLLPLAGGIALLRKASKIKKLAARYKTYIDIVVNRNVKSIDNIASATGLSYDAATKDLQDMINIGYLKDAYIHQGNREIILKHQKPTPVAYAQMKVVKQAAPQAAPQTKAARCPGCGANNVVAVGRVSECEYCGTPINA